MPETHSTAPLVSVVLPTRNRRELLAEALQSVQRQTHQQLEIIVVNDASTDDTAAYLDSEAQRDRRLTVCHLPERRGAPAARNHAIALSRGEYVAFQDDDTNWSPHKVARLLDALEAAGRDTGFAYSPYESLELNGQRFVVGGISPKSKYHGPWRVGTCAVMLRRDVLTRSGVFDESLPRVQDVDLWIRVLAETGYTFVPEPLAVTRRVPGGISTNRAALRTAIAAIASKHRRESSLSSRDRAMMHYIFGHKLLLHNFWAAGMSQLVQSVSHRPTMARGWFTLATAALGPLPFRAFTRLQAEIDRLRWSNSSSRGSSQ